MARQDDLAVAQTFAAGTRTGGMNEVSVLALSFVNRSRSDTCRPCLRPDSDRTDFLTEGMTQDGHAELHVGFVGRTVFSGPSGTSGEEA